MSETFCLGALLAVIGGFLDAYTYLTRGRVFANAQTGNLVLLAMNLAGGQFQKAQYYLIPILAFIARRPYSRSHMPLLPKRPPAPLETNHHSVGNHYTGFGCFSSCRKLGYGSQCFGCTGLFYPGARLPKNQWQSSWLPPCVPEICVVVLNC